MSRNTVRYPVPPSEIVETSKRYLDSPRKPQMSANTSIYFYPSADTARQLQTFQTLQDIPM